MDGVDVLVVALRERGPYAPDVDVYGTQGAHAGVAPHLLGQVLSYAPVSIGLPLEVSRLLQHA